MIGTRTTEVHPMQQVQLQALYLRKIHEINEKMRKFYATYNDWDHADERLRAHYTREEYREKFIERWRAERHTYIIKLRDIRRGIIHE